MNIRYALYAIALSLAACGGSGGSSPGGSPGGSVLPTTAPTNTPATTVAGTVVQIPADAYGPVTMGSATYVSADATQTTPLVGATVVVCPVPVTGATPPATPPTGDVVATTTSTGAFTASVASAPAAATSTEPFVIPSNNILGITPPATGYYVEVFGTGANGTSAGVLIPLHRFVAASTSISLHVSTTSSAEAGALAAVNSDRAANGAGALTFDESAEEAARLHASDMGANGYLCHYDTHNVGPSSRYLASGGIGLTGESIEDDLASDPVTAFSIAESTFMAEKTQTPPGGHYTNNVNVAHLWAGLGAAASAVYGGNYVVDYELVTPSAQDAVVGSSGYPLTTGCPTGITVNNS